MGVVVATLLQRRLVAEQMLGAPCHDVCLTCRNIDRAVRAPIGLLSSMRRNLAHKPFSSATNLLAGSPVCEPRHIAGRLLHSPLVLAGASPTRHA